MGAGPAVGAWAMRFVQKLLDDRAPTLGALLAWGMLNALLPLILCLVALAGLMLRGTPQADAVEEVILAVLPAQAAGAVQTMLDANREAAGTASLIGLGFLLFNGSNFFVSLQTVFNLAYHVPERNLVTGRLVSLEATLLWTCVLVGSTLAAVASATPRLSAQLNAAVGLAISVATLVLMFLLLYRVLPNKPQSWRASLPGASLASLLFVLILRLFPVYVQLFGQGFSIYAAFGTVLLVMFWLYLVGLVLVLGVELNAFLEAPERSTRLASVAALALSGQLEPAPPPRARGSAAEHAGPLGGRVLR